MKLKYIFTAILLSVTQTAVAGISAQPTHCPQVSNLQNAQITQMYQNPDSKWLGASNQDFFGTSEKWILMVSAANAATKAQAIENIKQSLTTLRYTDGPNYDPDFYFWKCNYISDIGPAHTYTQ